MPLQKAKKNLTLAHFNSRIDRIEELLLILCTPAGLQKTNDMMLDQLRQKVAAATSVAQSLKTLLSELANRFRTNADDPDKINELADEVEQCNAELAQDVVKNTPSQTNESQEG